MDIAATICIEVQRYKEFHHGRPPRRLMLGREEYAEFRGLNLDHEALGINVTEESSESMMVLI